MDRGNALHVCGACRKPFVVPRSLLEVPGDARFVVELGCNNCGRVTIAVHDDRALEALDRELDRTEAAMSATADALRHGLTP